MAHLNFRGNANSRCWPTTPRCAVDRRRLCPMAEDRLHAIQEEASALPIDDYGAQAMAAKPFQNIPEDHQRNVTISSPLDLVGTNQDSKASAREHASIALRHKIDYVAVLSGWRDESDRAWLPFKCWPISAVFCHDTIHTQSGVRT